MKTLISLAFVCGVISLFNLIASLRLNTKIKYLFALLFAITGIRYALLILYANITKLNNFFYIGKITLIPMITFTCLIYLLYITTRNEKVKLFDWLYFIVFALLETYLIYIIPINFIRDDYGFKFLLIDDYKNYLLLLLAFFAVSFIFILVNAYKKQQILKHKITTVLYIIGYSIFIVQAIMLYLNLPIITKTLITEIILLIAIFIDIYEFK